MFGGGPTKARYQAELDEVAESMQPCGLKSLHRSQGGRLLELLCYTVSSSPGDRTWVTQGPLLSLTHAAFSLQLHMPSFSIGKQLRAEGRITAKGSLLSFVH